MEKLFNFQLTLNEAQIAVAGLRKLPMEVAESVVKRMEAQFAEQNKPEEPVAPTTDEQKAEETKAA